jgi:sarcosine oxidase
MRDVDYLVVGLGGMGSAALYHLARMGKSVVGIEQFELDHKLGSSHGHSRAVRTFYRDPLYTELAEAAIALWQELEKASGVALLYLSGWLGFARGANMLFDSHLEAVRKSGIPFELMDSSSVSKRFPALRIASDARACFTPRAGFIDASRAVHTHLGEA